MKYFNLYRMSSVLLILFFLGQLFGGVLSEPSRGPAADLLWASMKTVHYACMGFDCTWYATLFGYGLLTSVFLLLVAFLAWHLGGLSPAQRAPLAFLAWTLFISMVLTAILSWIYFFPMPGVMASLISVLLGTQCFRQLRAA